MAELLLVNPRRRRKARKTRSRGRRRMSALQRKYFGGGRRKRRRTRAVAAAPRRRRRRTAARLTNPRRRRRSRRSLTRSVRRRRNPSLRGGISGLKNSAIPTLKAGFTGALGAIGLDFLWAYTSKYLPASVAGSALAQYGAKLLGAIVVGMIGDRVPLPFLRGRGRELANGAATVVLHDALKAQIQASFPGVQLGEYLTYAPTVGSMRQAGRLLSTGMGEYLSGLPSEVGFPQDASGYYGEGNGDFSGDGMSGYN